MKSLIKGGWEKFYLIPGCSIFGVEEELVAVAIVNFGTWNESLALYL